MKTLGMFFILFAMNVSAADVTGTWKATVKSENSTIKRTFVFKQDGTSLTGKTTSDRWGTSAIKDGKIEGDTLSFTMTVAIEFGAVKIAVTGKVKGDIIQMTAELSGKTLDFVARRAP
jgi:hypothetical protein